MIVHDENEALRQLVLTSGTISRFLGGRGGISVHAEFGQDVLNAVAVKRVQTT